jgi:hypothetical protein
MSSEDLTNSVNKLVELTKQIKDARVDIKVITDAEKKLKTHVKQLMLDNGLDVINVKNKIKISVKTSVKKSGLNKASVGSGLDIFFDGNKVQSGTALKIILDNLPSKESSTVSLTGINKE